jgi:mono/diheme cytochrome c family protein
MTLRYLVIAVSTIGLMATGAQAQPKIEKVPVTYTPPTSGPEMFTQYCAVCHGKSGKGDGPAASALKKAPADLTQLAAKNGGKFPEAVVSRYIGGDDSMAAHGTRDMPMWGDLFLSLKSDPAVVQLRITNLTNYVKTLQK